MRRYDADAVRTHTETGTITAGTVVVQEDGRIAWVGPTADLPLALADLVPTVVPGTLMPGLVDTHVHLGFDGGPTPVERMEAESDAEQVVTMLRSARQLLSAGVTTARDLGARGYLDVVVRDAVAAGDARGPRIVASGSPLTPTGGHCWFMGGEADGGDALRKLVRTHHQHDVDSIKVMATGGFMTPGSGPAKSQFSLEELALATADAHRLGKKVVAHAHGTAGIMVALGAGVDALEHCTFVLPDGSFGFDPDVADAIAASGVAVSFTLNVMLWRLLSEGSDHPIAAHVPVLVRELRAREVPIVVGTDAGIDHTPHFAYAGALEGLHLAGLTVEEVLLAATVGGATAMGLENEIGSLRAGMVADLVGVPGDPSADLTVLRRPTLVLAAGVPFTPDPYPTLSELPAPPPLSLDANEEAHAH